VEIFCPAITSTGVISSAGNLRRVIESRSLRGQGMWHVWGTGEANTGFWRENLREGDHLEGLSIDGRIILKRNFEQWDGEARTQFI